MKYSFSYQTPVGRIWLAEENGALSDLSFGPVSASEEQETPVLRLAAGQLEEYFAGGRQKFDLPLNAQGTLFQKSVWAALQDIPYGGTCSYGDIAAAVGNKKACRAVGMANNKNPLPIFIPCHRVIGANGNLTGYGGGLDIKRALLALEQKYQ